MNHELLPLVSRFFGFWTTLLDEVVFWVLALAALCPLTYTGFGAFLLPRTDYGGGAFFTVEAFDTELDRLCLEGWIIFAGRGWRLAFAWVEPGVFVTVALELAVVLSPGVTISPQPSRSSKSISFGAGTFEPFGFGAWKRFALAFCTMTGRFWARFLAALG